MPSPRITLFALLALVLLGAPFQIGSAQAGSGTDIITGVVSGPDKQPLANARVQVVSVETGTARSRTTDARGRYTILFPDGGGQYRLVVRLLGYQPTTITLNRLADEDRLEANITMATASQTLSAVTVTANRAPMASARDPRPTPGSTERSLSGEALLRLPIDPSDPNAVALLAAGVVGISASDTSAAAFSVAGQRTDQNQVTLDGLSFGSGAGGVPQEAVRSTRVVTSTFDVARGQFSGGQVNSTTRGGTNDVSGSLGYALRDPSLQLTDQQTAGAGFGGAFTQHQLSGGVGGPFIQDRSYWFLSAQVRRRSDPLQSLLGAAAPTLNALGVSADSAARFTGILNGLGLPLTTTAVPDDRLNDNASLLGRFDHQLNDDHTLTLRLNWQGTLASAFRTSPQAVPSYAGDQWSSGGGAMLSMTSTFGTILNEFRGVYNLERRGTSPYLSMPAGRAIVSSELPSGATGIASLQFGGNPALPTSDDNQSLELTNEASWLFGRHRLKFGGLLNYTDYTSFFGTNRNGTYLYNSLSDLEQNRPASYTRSLSTGRRAGGAVNGAVYLGDSWRVGRMQYTYGVRAEATSYPTTAGYNAVVDSTFGRRTDRFPTEYRISPRVGFTWMVGGSGMPGMGGGGPPGGEGGGGGPPGGMMGGGGPPGGMMGGGPPMGMMGGGIGDAGGPPNIPGLSMPFIIRGGIGEFRGRAPTQLFSSALEATGLANGESLLQCVGAVVPTPDWNAYRANPGSAPDRCADGGLGQPTTSVSRPNVTLFDPDFDTPRTWRASLGVSRRIKGYNVSVDGSYALGVAQTGIIDRNLAATPRFLLASEGDRPVYVAASDIVPTSGVATLTGSRRDARFGTVYEINSALRSKTGQITASLGGSSFGQLSWNTSYTYTQSRDQSPSFNGGGGGGFAGFGGGGGGFGTAVISGDPNSPQWAISDQDRRHNIVGTTQWLAKPWIDVTTTLRLSSGGAYTPRVGQDINGDGVANDAAFIFDSRSGVDTAMSRALSGLLAGDGASADCLRAQVGQVATRNSCRQPWSTALDLQVNLRPYLGPSIQRKATIQLALVNPLAGIDRLVNGADNLRGWGQQGFVDPTLLYVRGFDASAQRYVYAVNENFGRNNAGRTGMRNPFQIGINVRYQLGPDRQRQMLEGMVRGGSSAGGAPGGFNVKDILSRIAPTPIAPIVAMRDSIGLTRVQVASLDSLQVSFDAELATIVSSLTADVDRLAKNGGDFTTLFPKLQPKLQEARTVYLAFVASAKKVLTPAQWEQLPESIRNPTLVPGGRPPA